MHDVYFYITHFDRLCMFGIYLLQLRYDRDCKKINKTKQKRNEERNEIWWYEMSEPVRLECAC